MIARVLRETGDNKSKAARRLCLTRTQLYVRLRELRHRRVAGVSDSSWLSDPRRWYECRSCACTIATTPGQHDTRARNQVGTHFLEDRLDVAALSGNAACRARGWPSHHTMNCTPRLASAAICACSPEL